MSTGAFTEADSLMASAKKHLKTGLFKRKPDWGSAADDYERAGGLYVSDGNVEKACEAYNSACEAYEKVGSIVSASLIKSKLAQFLAEQARKGCGGKSLDKKLMDSAVESYRGAARYYALDGKFDRMAETLVKAAELIDPTTHCAFASPLAAKSNVEGDREKVKQVCALLEEAADAIEENEDNNNSYIIRLPDIYRKWMLACLRSGDVLRAIAVLERQLGITNGSGDGTSKIKGKCAGGFYARLNQPHNVAKTGLEIIVLCLSLGDLVLARMKLDGLRGISGFANTKEESTARSLLDAFGERDTEMLQETLKDSTLMFITNDISRMAKKLVIRSTEAKPDTCEGGEVIDGEEDLR